MKNLTEQQKKKLLKLARLADMGESAIIEYLLEMEDKFDTTLLTFDNKVETLKNEVAPTLNNILEQVKGKDGINGENGMNGENGVDGKDGLNGRDGINGKNGKDGRDGRDGIDGKDGIDGLDGLNGSPDTGEQIIDKINTNNSAKKILLSQIEGGKNYDDEIATLQNRTQILNQLIGSRSGGVSKIIAGSNITISPTNGLGNVTINATGGGTGYTKETPTGTVNGSNTSFTVTATPVYVVSDGATYFENAGYTIAGLTITMTVPPQSFIRSFY